MSLRHNNHLCFLSVFFPLLQYVNSRYLIDQDPIHWSPPHTHEMHLHLFSLSSRAASFLLLFIKPCLCACLAWWRGCEVLGLKWVQISREMDKRVWRIKLCDVTSGIGRHPCLLIEPSEKHFTERCGLNTGLSPSQAKAQSPHKLLFYFHPPLLARYSSFCSVNNHKNKMTGSQSLPLLIFVTFSTVF